MRSEMLEGFARHDRRFDSLQRTLILGMAGLMAAMIAAAVTLATTLG